MSSASLKFGIVLFGELVINFLCQSDDIFTRFKRNFENCRKLLQVIFESGIVLYKFLFFNLESIILNIEIYMCKLPFYD